ncbi:MAG: PEGA domain-containing protein, partial [Sandaracinaceae bacterium]
MRSIAGFAFALALLGTASSARAQDADELIQEGVHAREAREDARALELFRQAQSMRPSGEALAQIALAEQALGRFVQSEEHLRDALVFPNDPFVERNRRLLEGALEEISASIGTLTITGSPTGAAIFVEGREVGRLPLPEPIRVDAGSCEVVAVRAGYEEARLEVTVEGGGNADVTVVLSQVESLPDRDPDVPPTAEAREADGDELLLILGIALASAAGVALVGGAIALGVREDAAQQRLTCSDTDPGCRDLYGRAVDAEAA